MATTSQAADWLCCALMPNANTHVKCTPTHTTSYSCTRTAKETISFQFVYGVVSLSFSSIHLLSMCVSLCVNGKLLMFWFGIRDLLLCGTV
jgi:hypothetical protein